jgi:uncharacterized protein (TIGR03437 family)
MFRTISPDRKYLRLPVLLAALLLPASAQITAVVNAASQVSGPTAPGTIVTIFGSNLARNTVAGSGSATPPSTLGGVTVTVGGVPAPLYYVSPTQINAIVAFATPTGSQNLTVTSSAGTFSAPVNITATAQPGIFSLLGSGTGDGAIINPLTLAIGTFTVRSGKDRTYLSLFLTGLSTSVFPVVTVGGVPVEVLFSGPSPCCLGMEQINVVLPASLSGAGRVPVSVQSGTLVSNTVEIVLLPAVGEGPFPNNDEDMPRSRQLASIAWIPGTSLALIADENDDVIRVIDLSSRKVVRTVALPSGAGPIAVSVNAAGTVAVIAERRTGQLAVLDLTTYNVISQIAVGSGPLNVAIAGNLAIVVNGNAGSVSIVDLPTKTVLKTLPTGAGVHAVAVDPILLKAWVTNQTSGTISVIDLTTLTVVNTFSLGPNVRPAGIRRIANSNFLAVAVPVAGSAGQTLIVNINDGSFTTINVNSALSGGSSDIAVSGSTLFFANQTGGSVSVISITSNGVPTGLPLIVKVDLGARALAVDTKDNLLLVTNDGSGTIVLVDLRTFAVVGRIDGVRTGLDGDDNEDNHSDREHSSNLPVITAVAPLTARANTTFTLTLIGSGFTGTDNVVFVSPGDVHGNGKGKGKGDSPDLNSDTAFSATNIVVNAAGTGLTATVKVGATAPGPRVVLVKTPNGESAWSKVATALLTIVP